ncbi:hypothetical protein Pth03_80530 [Planotetraspora thailandica]|uniref:Uncharacterized protein n=1 Tax=Planotetraspora thailandica TaxID=487172 RepID=A0A8J3Y2M9_9ACTN|nr:hypothetical protein Pth03_80530 [Planotetraspora thailandica]
MFLAGAFTYEAAAVAGEVAELADGFGVDEAGSGHAALDDFGQPDRVELDAPMDVKPPMRL